MTVYSVRLLFDVFFSFSGRVDFKKYLITFPGGENIFDGQEKGKDSINKEFSMEPSGL